MRYGRSVIDRWAVVRWFGCFSDGTEHRNTMRLSGSVCTCVREVQPGIPESVRGKSEGTRVGVSIPDPGCRTETQRSAPVAGSEDGMMHSVCVYVLACASLHFFFVRVYGELVPSIIGAYMFRVSLVF